MVDLSSVRSGKTKGDGRMPSVYAFPLGILPDAHD
jgi:hypothetical protein